MSHSNNNPSHNDEFDSEEQLWGYIEEQEEILSKAERAFSKARENPTHIESPFSFADNERLARSGDPVAQYNLSIAYAKGQGVTKDLERAAYWLTAAAAGGFAPAQYNLGCCLLEQNDPQKALEWFRAAADQHFGPAQYNIATFFYNCGNFLMAYVYFYLAALNGVVQAWDRIPSLRNNLPPEQLREARLMISAMRLLPQR